MDDLINRQAAIDAISSMFAPTPTQKDMVEDCLEIIENLPSAQRWIPCSERLPKNRQYVLVTYQYEYGLIDHGITWYGEAEKKWNTSRNVTAWMPLPEPYKGEQE